MAQENLSTPENDSFTQPYFWGPEAEPPKETELDNCLVLERPVYEQTGNHKEWRCALRALPSVFEPERDWNLLVFATNDIAVEALKKRLKPGDRTILRGVVTAEQPVLLQSGETQLIYRLLLTKVPTVTSREKRVSTTVYEQQRKRR